MFDWLPAWTREPAFLGAAGVVSIVTIVASALLLPILVARLPPDYFVRESRHGPFHDQHPVVAFLGHVAKNALGAMLVLAGLVMLMLPGQGVLTVLAGIFLLDFPRKRQLELWLVRRPALARALNWLRDRRGQPPLILESEEH